MKSCLVVVAMTVASSTAMAGPLGVMWQSKATCPDPRAVESARGLLWLDGNKLVRWAAATGVALAPVKLKGKSPMIVAASPEVIVVKDAAEITVMDGTLHIRWRHPAAADDQVAVAGGDIVLAGQHTVELLDGATGKPKWSVPGTKAERPFVVATTTQVILGAIAHDAKAPTTLVARALADGAQKWTAKVDSPADGLAKGETVRAVGDVLAIATEFAVVLVGPDGKPTTLALGHVTLGRAIGDRLYASDYRLMAIDVPARKQAWVTTASLGFVSATADAVYAMGSNDLLVEVDPKSGKSLSTFSLGGQNVSGYASAPHVLACDGKLVLALDSSVPDAPTEAATITGTITCDLCADATVYAGAIAAKTDANGKFAFKLSTRGIVAVTAELALGRITPVGVVRLDGSHAYALGTVELEDPVGK